MNTENVSTLKIHKLTREQYERELGAGRIDPMAIYLTPNEELLSIEQGGTGANNAADALVNLGAAPVEHLDDTNNPHGVTALQVGLGNVDNTSDMDKPVSTAQAAAIADAKKAGTDAQGAIDTHVADKNNPHGVTIAQIGAAPVGYGYGEASGMTYIAGDSNGTQTTAEIEKRFATLGDGFARRISVCDPSSLGSGYVFEGKLYRLNANEGTLELYAADGTAVKRCKVSGAWQPWEWVNPPMVADVEYRTTERCDGKPVYRKLVVYTHSGKFGDSATNTDYTIPHGISDWARSVRCVTSINNDVTGSYLGSTGGILCVLGFGATNINVRVYKTYFNSPIFRFDLAYIKE